MLLSSIRPNEFLIDSAILARWSQRSKASSGRWLQVSCLICTSRHSSQSDTKSKWSSTAMEPFTRRMSTRTSHPALVPTCIEWSVAFTISTRSQSVFPEALYVFTRSANSTRIPGSLRSNRYITHSLFFHPGYCTKLCRCAVPPENSSIHGLPSIAGCGARPVQASPPIRLDRQDKSTVQDLHPQDAGGNVNLFLERAGAGWKPTLCV